MNGEAVDSIISLATERAKQSRKFFTVPSEPDDVYYLVDGDGDIERVVADAAPISVTVRSTAALLQLARQAVPEPLVETLTDNETTSVVDLKTSGASAQIFYCDTCAELVITNADGESRTLRHVLPLPKHPVFVKLEQLLGTRKFTQRELIKFLRAELNANVDVATIEYFRNLKLSTVGEGHAVVEQGRSSISRSLQQAIKSERGENMLDEITVSTPVYDLDELRTQRLGVTVLVDCLPDEHGTPIFELTTVHSSLQAAKADALQSIAFALQQGPHSVIYGEVEA